MFGDKSANKKVTKEHGKKVKKEKKTVKWAKTDHEFLTKDQLRRYRRMLGDTLIVQGDVSAKDFVDALNHADKEHGEQIGAYLIKNDLITEEQMIKALGHVKHIQFVPDEVVKKLDYEAALEGFDRKKLEEQKILPLSFEDGTCIIGVCNETRDEDIKAFEKEHDLKARKMYVMEPVIKKSLKVDKAKKKNNQSKKLQALKSYHEGVISFEQVVLIGMYSIILGQDEFEVRKYMGI